MKKLIRRYFFSVSLLCSLLYAEALFSQNVGIGTTNPSSRLDVNGDINTNGQVKLNGQSGQAGQVIMKDASNNPVWADLTEFKNFIVFDCSNVAGSSSSNDCSYNWTVPANVTTILVECWGGGGGGGSTAGGGGGGYIVSRYTVNAGDNALIQVGAGGKGYVLLSGVGASGGTSFFRINGSSVFASGGGPGSQDLWASPLFTVLPGAGGSFSISGLVQNFIGWNGNSGDPTKKRFEQASATVFGLVLEFGNGGDAGKSIGSGGKGGWYYSDPSATQIIRASPEARYQGGGGGADYNAGGAGKGGRVIIRW